MAAAWTATIAHMAVVETPPKLHGSQHVVSRHSTCLCRLHPTDPILGRDNNCRAEELKSVPHLQKSDASLRRSVFFGLFASPWKARAANVTEGSSEANVTVQVTGWGTPAVVLPLQGAKGRGGGSTRVDALGDEPAEPAEPAEHAEHAQRTKVADRRCAQHFVRPWRRSAVSQRHANCTLLCSSCQPQRSAPSRQPRLRRGPKGLAKGSKTRVRLERLG